MSEGEGEGEGGTERGGGRNRDARRTGAASKVRRAQTLSFVGQASKLEGGTREEEEDDRRRAASTESCEGRAGARGPPQILDKHSNATRLIDPAGHQTWGSRALCRSSTARGVSELCLSSRALLSAMIRASVQLPRSAPCTSSLTLCDVAAPSQHASRCAQSRPTSRSRVQLRWRTASTRVVSTVPTAVVLVPAKAHLSCPLPSGQHLPACCLSSHTVHSQRPLCRPELCSQHSGHAHARHVELLHAQGIACVTSVSGFFARPSFSSAVDWASAPRRLNVRQGEKGARTNQRRSRAACRSWQRGGRSPRRQ